MKKFKKVLVGLDLGPMDEVLIRKTAELVRILGTEMIYFVHVAKDLALSEEVKQNYPDILGPVDETLEKEISATVRNAGFPPDVSYEVEAKEGSPSDKILRWSKVKDVDLIIMGRKHELKGSGTLAKRIALKSPCSVLFLTEKMPSESFNRILVPIDFSSYSALTLAYSQEISNDQGSTLCLHIFEVPHGYSKTGKTHEEFAEIMRENAKKDYRQFIKKHDLPEFDFQLQVEDDGNREDLILRAAKKEGADLILIGSRGRTDSAALLIGSVAEKLINVNNEIPMLVIKKKGENMHFLEALFRV